MAQEPRQVRGPSDLWRATEGHDSDHAMESGPSNGASGPSSLWREDEGSVATATAPAAAAPSTLGEVPDIWTREGPEPANEGTEIAPEPAPGGRRRRRPRARKVIKRSVAALVVIALLLFAADLAYSGAGAYSALKSLRSHLASARSQFRTGHLDEARAFLRTGGTDAAKALRMTRRPAMSAVGAIPALGDDVESIRAIALAGELAAEAGKGALTAAERIGFLGRGIPSSLYSDGRVDFATLDAATPGISRAQTLLDDAASVLRAAPGPTLGVVNDALTKATDQVESAANSAKAGSALVSLLPGLLGKDSPRTYLLAFQALGEARGTGGVIGLYGLLHASDGSMRLGHIAPFTDFQQAPLEASVAAPKWFSKNYGPQFATKQWQQANLSPNFPAVAQVLLNQYEAGTGKSLDGVIAMDPITLQDLMTATGPLRDPDTGAALQPDDVATALMKSSYLRFPNHDDQNAYLTALVQQFWKKIKDGDLSGPALLRGIETAVTSQHLKIYSGKADEQSQLATLNADGSYEQDGPNVQLVYTNNYSSNKVDYFMHRKIDTVVKLTDTGQADVETTVHLDNRAPAGPASALLGLASNDVPPGTNRSLLNYLLPENADLAKIKVDGQTATPFTYHDDTHLVAWHQLTLPPGSSSVASVTYSVPGAASISSDDGSFSFTLFPQATVRPDAYSFELDPPPGWRLQTDDGKTLDADTPFTVAGDLEQPVTISLNLIR